MHDMKTYIEIATLAFATVAGMAGCAGGAPAVDATRAVAPKAVTPSGELRFIQYNIRSFEGYATNWDRCTEAVKCGQMVERFALELALYDPDLICLEEVPSEAIAARLAARMGMHYAHFKGGWKSEGWPEGISGAVLSKYPILEAKPHPSLNWTDRPEDLFTRFWGRVVLDTPGGPLAVHAMHGYHADSKIRLRELAEVLPVVQKDVQAGKSVILMGDLNHEPNSREYAQIVAAGLADSFTGLTGTDLLTYPSTVRKERIDYIWSAGPISKRLKSAKVLFEGAFRTNPNDPESFALSDHVPVLAVFSMPK
jgi:endonuclease/exonuclease/phosphatase family metal-dependent hydrolase